MSNMIINLCLVVFAVLITTCRSAIKLDYYGLHNHLFSAYEKHIRPVNDDAEVLEVFVEFKLISISELREKDQTLVSLEYIEMRWEDDFLSWDPADYNDLQTMVVPQSLVWRPDVVVGNSVLKISNIGFDELPVRLTAQGIIEWIPSELFETTCDINVLYYPFDTQVCSILLQTMVSLKPELELSLNPSNSIDLTGYGANGQWDLISAVIEDRLDLPVASVEVKLTMKRRPTFYVLNVLLPIIFLSLMGSLVFALPADAGEKISLAVTLLLAYVVFLTIVADSMPQTSLQISLLALYLTILIALSAFSVVISVAILRIYHKDPNIPVPRYIVRMVRMQCRVKSPRLSNAVSEMNKDELMTPCTERDVTWQDVSKATDNFFFVFYMVLTVIASVVLLVLMIRLYVLGLCDYRIGRPFQNCVYMYSRVTPIKLLFTCRVYI